MVGTCFVIIIVLIEVYGSFLGKQSINKQTSHPFGAHKQILDSVQGDFNRGYIHALYKFKTVPAGFFFSRLA